MTSRILVSAVAIGCLAAAGTGGYLAVRTATDSAEAAGTELEQAQDQAQPDTTAETLPATPLTASPAPEASPAPAPEPAQPRVVRTARTSPAPAEAPEAARPAAPAPEPTAPPPTLSVSTTQPSAIPIHPGRSIELPGPRYDIVELPTDAVIGIRLESTISSETAEIEDRVTAEVTRPVIIDGLTAIPAGARLSGVVTLVERGGQFRERARIGVQFTSVTLDTNVHVPIQTEAIYRVGEAPTGEATAKIGASAVVGSILGGVFGGKKGAAIGGVAGAAGGTAIVARGERNAATLTSGSSLTVRLAEPARFEVER